MRTRKAERVLDKRQQHPPDEHTLDLFLNAPQADDELLATADKSLRSVSVFIAAPDARGAQSEAPQLSQEPTGAFLPGMVLLKSFLAPRQQQQLVDDARALGLRTGGFYKPTYASGAKCRLHQMCLGRHWNVVTEQYEDARSNFDDAPVQPLPESWAKLAIKSLETACAVDPRVMGSCASMTPDICVVNYYKKAGRNGMHVDKDESAAAMTKGSPVVSFSIGAAAEFAFLDHYPSGNEAVPIVRLESGDVLVFGGPARGVVHALTRVYASAQPSWLRMRSGRLNLTFREFEPIE